MSTSVHSARSLHPVKSSPRSQIIAWITATLFILGFIFPLIGAWTGSTLSVWFVCTQKPRRGYLWLLAFSLVPALVFNWRKFPVNGPLPAFEYLGASLLFVMLAVLPLTFHRLTSLRLPGLLSTLPFPMAAVAMRVLVLPRVPAGAFNLNDFVQSQQSNTPLLTVGAAFGVGAALFLVDWFASTLVWMWNQEFRASQVGSGAGAVATVFVLIAGFGIFRQVSGNTLPATLPIGTPFAWICLGGAAVASIFAILNLPKTKLWTERPGTVALLQSPLTGNPLHVITEHRREVLAATTGERFPIRNGIPVFLTPHDLTGDNGKYNHLYETIGGFYDDTQRFFSAFRGIELDSYFLNYMSLLDVKPGDSVLETSVGTGLNFKYLPRGVKLSGLDLSAEMLANCQANLRRWQMDADLYLGNAESLPFADCSFDVVYTAGAINFFSDRAKAIREMIRVARPGSLLMIEDETEEYAKATYERIPITSAYYKDRKEAITIPVDLVPPEMEDIHVEMLKDGKFYAITFRKPAVA